MCASLTELLDYLALLYFLFYFNFYLFLYFACCVLYFCCLVGKTVENFNRLLLFLMCCGNKRNFDHFYFYLHRLELVKTIGNLYPRTISNVILPLLCHLLQNKSRLSKKTNGEAMFNFIF